MTDALVRTLPTVVSTVDVVVINCALSNNVDVVVVLSGVKLVA